ncbi:PREDICTED: transmembrane and immunoglobulin domain-containing protein 2-like [Crocodylus porosus]|uniref:transmembrane and immunoglobulin domain-containing protein 2-like n=1 Tax=Crocodylus porosus TaxID=8502 RepID=UPI00093CBF8A|nr:PREDICTED: transmembrane and immunoglobulin domain-containing protein 2-like [Crocodylus porosus]
MSMIILKVFLLTVFSDCLVTDIDTLKVSQTPTKIIASAGQSVEVTCTWENHDRVERYRVTWEKQNLSSEGPSTEKLKEEVCNTSSTVHTNKAMLELKPVNVNNTGIYFCEINVEIPYLKRGKGNGTTLIVAEEDSTSVNKNYYFMTISVIVPILLSGGWLYLHCKRQQDSQNSVPVGRPQEEQMLQVSELNEGNEERNEADDGNSSSNSSEWAISVLYDSLDYFVMRRDEDKRHPVTSTSDVVDQ